MANNTPQDVAATYLDAYADFKGRVEYRDFSQAEVHSFQQEWGDTTCGHGGVGGQAITPAQTHVFNVRSGGWYVYQNGRFSYKVERANDQFFDDLRDWQLVGEVDYDGQYER